MKKRLITKSNEVQSETRRGHASRPYNSAGRHLVRTSSNVTSSDARRPICPEIVIHWVYALSGHNLDKDEVRQRTKTLRGTE